MFSWPAITCPVASSTFTPYQVLFGRIISASTKPYPKSCVETNGDIHDPSVSNQSTSRPILSTYQPGSCTAVSDICLNLKDTLFPDRLDTSYAISNQGILTELVHENWPAALTYCLPSQTSVPEKACVLVI